MTYKLVENSIQLEQMLQDLSESNNIYGLDTETTALKPKDGKLRVIQINKENSDPYVIDCFKFDSYKSLYKLKAFLEDKQNKFILHNVKFDYQWLLYHLNARLGTFFDTYIADTLCDFSASHSLASVALRHLNVVLDKTEQKSDWSGVLSSEQLEYAAKDVLHFHSLREKLIQKLQETGQLGAAKLEFDSTPAFAQMEMQGFPVDVEKYTRLVESNEREMKRAGDVLLNFLQTRGGKLPIPRKIYQEDLFGEEYSLPTEDDINVSSWQQVLPVYQELGIPITTTDQKVLKPLLAEYPELKYLIEYRDWAKLCSAFGRKFLDKVENGRVYAEYRQLGAVTGRVSGSNPNLMQIPSDNDFRECFAPTQGRKLIISDYSGYELRILADISNDSVMLDVFNSGKDLHSMTAVGVFGIPYDEAKTKYKKQRTAAKIGNFSIVYGINPVALMNRLKSDGVEDATEEMAKQIIDGFYGTYKGAAKWLFGQEKAILKNPVIRGAGGHLMKVNLVRGDRSSEKSAGRDARNYPIQHLNAASLKIALAKIHDKLISNYKNAYLVNSVHDEILVECDDSDAKEVSNIVETSMVSAGKQFLKKVNVVADAGICSSWAEKS